MTHAALLDPFAVAAETAAVAETQYRREAAQRIAALEQQRAFAFRRLNLMRAVVDAVAASASEEAAAAHAGGVLRGRLGWATDSAARDEVLERFAPVARAAFRGLAPEEDAAAVPDALAEFEAWYAACHPAPFWVLLEHPIAEAPLVDF
jgi:hypothetical protein